jgi:hypothetical protein
MAKRGFPVFSTLPPSERPERLGILRQLPAAIVSKSAFSRGESQGQDGVTSATRATAFIFFDRVEPLLSSISPRDCRRCLWH